jgi:hypothetical protein
MAEPIGIDLYPEQPEILKEARVPIVTTHRPTWYYITSVCVCSGAEMPTETEQRQIAEFHRQYVSYWYGTAPGQFTAWYNRQRAKYEFDVDGNANGRVLLRRKRGDWACLRRSWEHGPQPMLNEPPVTLPEALDRVCCSSSSWERWKSASPELFGPKAYAAAQLELGERMKAADGQA